MAHGGSRGIAPLIPSLRTCYRWAVNFRLQPLSLGNAKILYFICWYTCHVTRLQTERSGVPISAAARGYLSFETSRPTLERTTQPHVKWAIGVSAKSKPAATWRWPPTSIYRRREKWVELYLHSSFMARTWATLPFCKHVNCATYSGLTHGTSWSSSRTHRVPLLRWQERATVVMPQIILPCHYC
jgi:hypothetical protein